MSTLEFSQLLGNYGEFVGAIAIVVTLIYLAMQLRQNTRAIQSSERAYRSNLEVATNGRFFDFRRDIYSNPELRSIWIRGLFDPDLLTHNEWYSFTQFFVQFLLSIGEQFRIEPDLLVSRREVHTAIFSDLFRYPGGRRAWMGTGYDEEFTAFVNEIYEQTSVCSREELEENASAFWPHRLDEVYDPQQTI